MWMEGLSIKIPAELRRRLAAEAVRRNVTQSAVVRKLIEQALAGGPEEQAPDSCALLAGDLLGSVRSGRSDLATNRTLLKEAIVQGERRAPKRRR